MKRTRIKQIVLPTLITILTLPPVLAARSGFRAIDGFIETMGRVFYPSILMRSEMAQVGFYKFLYFFVMFAAANYGLNKVFNKGNGDSNGKRTAGIIAFAFSAIAAFFMPESIALGSAGVITALFTNIIPFGLTGLALWFAFGSVKQDSPWYMHLFGLLAILMAIVIINGYLAFLPG